MPASSFRLAIQVGARVGSSFKAAVKGSQAQLNQLGSAIGKLKRQQQSIQRVELAEAGVGKARAAYESARQELLTLRRALANTEAPSQQLTQAFERAKTKTQRLSAQLANQRGRLQQAKQALSASGIATSNLTRENGRLGQSLARLDRRYQRLQRSMQAQSRLKEQRSQLRGQLFDAAALGTSVVAPLKVAVDFEQSIAKLGAITGAGETALIQLQTSARALGESTQFSASQAASAMTFLGMAGFETQQILAATPGMLNLAQAAGSELADTADIASNILSGFSLKAEDMGRVGDVLSATFTSSNTTLQMLGETLKYAAPVASAAGASIEEVAAMAGLMGNVGIQGSMAGTALRSAFLRLSAPPKEAAQALSQLGVEVKDLDGHLRSVPEVLTELAAATKEMGSADKAEAIKQIFGTEASAGMTELLKQAGDGALEAYIQRLQKAEGTTASMAKRMGATTAGSLKRLGSALESLTISLGSLLLPTVAAAADAFAGMASWASGLAQRYPLLTQSVLGVTLGLVALKISLVAGAYALSFMKGGALALVTGYRTLSAALTLAQLGMTRLNLLSGLNAIKTGVLTAAQWALNVAMNANPIGLIITGIAALAGAAVLLVRYWSPISDFFSELWGGIKTLTGETCDWLMESIQGLLQPIESLGNAWQRFKAWLSEDEEEAKTLLPDANSNTPQPGKVLAGQSTMAMPVQTSPAPSVLNAAMPSVKTHQSIAIDAPIHIHATPGMDAQAIAVEVKQQLDIREAEAARRSRTQLYDAP